LRVRDLLGMRAGCSTRASGASAREPELRELRFRQFVRGRPRRRLSRRAAGSLWRSGGGVAPSRPAYMVTSDHEATGVTVVKSSDRQGHRHVARGELRDPEAHHRRGITGSAIATLNGRELAVASYLTDHVCPLLLDGTPPASRTPGSFSTRAATAPGPGHHDRDRGRRHGPLGHQGQGGGAAVYQLLAAGAATASPSTAPNERDVGRCSTRWPFLGSDTARSACRWHPGDQLDLRGEP